MTFRVKNPVSWKLGGSECASQQLPGGQADCKRERLRSRFKLLETMAVQSLCFSVDHGFPDVVDSKASEPWSRVRFSILPHRF